MKGVRSERIKEAMNKVLEAIENEKLEYVALAIFKGNGKPSDKWSFFNRFLMYAVGTTDARGFKQWQQVGRYVKKGAKAFYILAPIKKKVPVVVKEEVKEVDEEGNEVIRVVEKVIYVEKLVGFKPVPVFRYEDTYGKPLKQEEFNVEIPCEFEPLIKELGLNITTAPFNGNYYGCYKPYRKEIELASPELIVFLHELTHAVDHKLNNLKGTKEEKEVIAEFGAAVIAYMLGYKVDLKQVKYYLHQFKRTTIFKVLNRVEKIVSYVLQKTATQAF